MRSRNFGFAMLFVLITLGCDGGEAVDDAGADGAVDVDGGTDAGLPPRTMEELPAPGELRAGVARVPIPAPVGIGTMGFGAIGQDPSPSPFAVSFPATTRIHAELDFRAVALSRGPAHEVVFVRMDTVGVFQQLREAVLDELERRLGRSLDDALVLAGNHTHSGPGRLLMTDGALRAAADHFFPEFYERVVNALADVVEQALDDLAPAEVGLGLAATSEAHNDRRCENDALDQPQEIPDIPLVVVRRGGQIDAVVATYAYHGTVLGISQLTLSGDMGSVVEQRIEERFDHPMRALFFNSYGADMSPGSPSFPPDAMGAELPRGYDRMERLGEVVADVVMPAIGEVEFTDALPIRARTYAVRLDREVLGYGPDEFNYPHGGLFCGLNSDGNCVDDTPIEGLDSRCIPISAREGLPKQTLLTVGEIGDHRFFTGPGEWSTGLASSVIERIRADGGDAFFIGYANDYAGYSISEEDWWQGGYEASGHIWGPRQGDYLAARAYEAYETFRDLWVEPPWREPARLPAFSGYELEAYVPETPVDVGAIVEDVPSTATATDIVSFTVRGADPWLGAPVAILERDDGEGFTPVLRPNGRQVESTSYDLWVDLSTEPTYEETLRAAERTFLWTFHLPVARRASTSIPPLVGPHRFRVEIPTVGEPVVTETSAFVVE